MEKLLGVERKERTVRRDDSIAKGVPSAWVISVHLNLHANEGILETDEKLDDHTTEATR